MEGERSGEIEVSLARRLRGVRGIGFEQMIVRFGNLSKTVACRRVMRDKRRDYDPARELFPVERLMRMD